MDLKITTLEGDEYRPLPQQAKFHASAAKYRAYVGAFRAGKTACGGVEALLQSLEYPGKHGQGLVARYEYGELIGTTWKQLTALIPREVVRDIVLSKPAGPKITLKNGFEIIGRNAKDHEDLTSFSFAWAWLDECNEDGIDISYYNQICGRLSDRLGSRQVWLTGNPAGKNWVWERFFAHEEGGRQWANHEGFHAKTRENIYVPDDYVDELRLIYPEDWIEKFLEGRFDIFEGAVFDTWRPEIHVVPPFDLPSTWPRFRGVDHGLTNPTACLWLGADFEGNYVFYREYYERNAIPAENARSILRLTGNEVVDWTVIDPSTAQKQTAGGTIQRIIDQYRDGGLYCQEGNNAVKDSIARIKMLLHPDPNRRFPAWHPQAGELGSPRLFVTSDLKAFRWEIERYKWKNVRGTVADKEQVLAKEDHLIACARYILMRNPYPAVEVIKRDTYSRFLDIVAEFEGKPLGAEELEYANVIGNEHLLV